MRLKRTQSWSFHQDPVVVAQFAERFCLQLAKPAVVGLATMSAIAYIASWKKEVKPVARTGPR